tara:strand:- start:563 stop:664 length:102 start_codon:yes stop_codon:yes gene_type:complete
MWYKYNTIFDMVIEILGDSDEEPSSKKSIGGNV